MTCHSSATITSDTLPWAPCPWAPVAYGEMITALQEDADIEFMGGIDPVEEFDRDEGLKQ